MTKKKAKKSRKKDKSPSKAKKIKKIAKKLSKKWMIVIGSSILIILFLSYFLGIKVNFLINDELNVLVDPKYQNIHAHNNETISVNFEIQNKNFASCKSSCILNFIDLETGSSISEEIIFNHNQKLSQSYDITLPEFGTGIRYYEFSAECKNLKSLLCPTTGGSQFRTSMISVDYNLSQREAIIKEEFGQKYDDWTNKFYEIEKNYFIQNLYFARIPSNIQEKIELLNTLIGVSDNLDIHRTNLKNSILIWNSEEYLTLNNSNFKFLDSESNKINQQLSNIKSEDIISTWNQISEKYSQIRELNPHVIKSSNILVNELSSSQLNKEFEKNILEILKLFDTINSNSVFSLNEHLINLNNSIVKLSNIILIIEGTVIKGNSINSEVKELLNQNNFSNISNSSNLCLNIFSNLNHLQNVSNSSISNSKVDMNLINNFTNVNCANHSLGFNSTNTFISTKFSLPNISLEYDFDNWNGNTEFDINDHKKSCCIFDQCFNCKDSGDTGKSPLIFIHGHTINEKNSPEHTMNVFSKVQNKLVEEEILNYGELDFYGKHLNIVDGEWGRHNKSISVRASYYYIAHYSLGNYEITAQKSERIENYAIRLKEIIDIVKKRTNSDKVIIIAHSMGGLVTREYTYLFGHENIDKIITINSPHNGVSKKISDFCPVLGSNKECNDMKQNSIFLNRLNSNEIPDNMYYAIRSVGCDMDGTTGDGIVTNESGYLDGATNFVIKGQCTDSLNTELHGLVLNPELYPEAFEIIKNIIKNKNE